MNDRPTVIDLDDRLATEETLELSALVIGRDVSSYLLALMLHHHGHAVAIVSRSHPSVMVDLQESIALKYLHQAAKRIRSIEHLSKNGFRIDFDSTTGDLDWHQLTDGSRNEFIQIKGTIENAVATNQIPVYEGLIVMIEDDLVRVLSEDERDQYAVLRPKHVFIGSDVCHATIKDHSKGLAHSTVLRTLADLMHLDRIPKSLAVIGGGIVGSSVASCIKLLGCARVVLIEGQEQCLSGFNDVDREIAAHLESDLIHQQIEIITNCKINYVNDTACYTSNNLIETDYRFIAVGTRRVRNTFINTPSANIVQLIERVSYGRKIQMGIEIDDGKGGTVIQPKIPILPIDYQRVRGACSIEEAVSIAYRTICQCFHKPSPTFFMPSFLYTVPSILLMGQTRVPADNMFICRISFPPTMKYASDKPPRGFGKLWIFRTRPILCGVQMISDYAEILGKAFGILIRNRIPLDELCDRIEIPGSIGEAIQLMIKQAMDQIQRH